MDIQWALPKRIVQGANSVGTSYAQSAAGNGRSNSLRRCRLRQAGGGAAGKRTCASRTLEEAQGVRHGIDNPLGKYAVWREHHRRQGNGVMAGHNGNDVLTGGVLYGNAEADADLAIELLGVSPPSQSDLMLSR